MSTFADAVQLGSLLNGGTLAALEAPSLRIRGLSVLPVSWQAHLTYACDIWWFRRPSFVIAHQFQVGEAMKRPRVLLADDHKEMRDRVTRHLEVEFDVLDAVADGRMLLDAASRLNPDVCLLDISMPSLNGIETAIQLKQRGSKAKVLFLTIHEDVDFLEAALRTGASGYVLKRRMTSDLRQAIRDALAGKTFVSSSVVLGARSKQNDE